MRAIGMMGLIGLLMCVGCSGDKGIEERLKKAEARADAIAEHVKLAETNIAELTDIVSKMNETHTQAADTIKRLLLQQQDNWNTMSNVTILAVSEMSDLSDRMDRIQGAVSNYFKANGLGMPLVTRTVKTTPAKISTAGVPQDIYDGIAADAARRFPTDYDMQLFLIKQQVEAYLKLHPK